MNPSNYVKNVGRSFGYIGYDVFKSFNPNLAQMMTDSKDLAKDIKDSVKGMKTTAGQKLGEMDLKNSIRNYGKDTWSNFKSDLKSGNFYNRDRREAAQSKAMESMFGGDDFDFGDDLDFNFDDDGDFDYGDGTVESEVDTAEVIVETSKKQIAASASQATYIADTITKSQEYSAKKIIAGNVASAEYLASIQRQTAGTICSVVERSSASVVNQLANMNVGISAIAQLSEPMAIHFQNASTYYTKSTDLQTKMVDYLEKLVTNTTPTDTRFKSSTKYTTIDDIIGLSGFDVKAYADMLKKNVKDMKESVSPMLDMVKMMTGGPSFKDSPISALATMGLNAMIPKDTKKTMKDFNEFLPSFFKSFFGGMQDKDFGFFGNMIKDFLLPKNRFIDTLDPSNYNKGKVDWNGKSEKALIEVIPYQLSQLVAAVTGQDQKIFDYNTGKWRRVAGIKNEWDNMKLKAGINAGGSYRTFVNDTLSKMGDNISAEQRKMIQKEIDAYFESTIRERDSRFRDINNDDFDYNKSGMSKETWELMRSINKSLGEQNNLFTQFVGEVYSARDAHGKKIREMSESGESIFNALFNNSLFDDKDELESIKKRKESNLLKGIKDQPNMSVNLGTDKYGYDIWFYLQGLYKNTKYLADNIGSIGGGSNRGIDILGNTGYYSDSGIFVPGKSFTNSKAERITSKGSSKENIIRSREQKAGVKTVSRISDSSVFSAVQEVLNYEKSGKSFIKLSPEAQKYKQTRDEAIAAGESYVKDDKLEKEIADVEAQNEEIQKSYDKIAGSAAISSVKDFQSSLTSIIGSPARMISKYLNAATVSMNRMLYGDTGSGQKGFGETLRDDLNSDFLKPLRDQLTKLFAPFKAIGDGIARVLFGTKNAEGQYEGKLLSNFANKTKESLGKAKDWAKGIFSKDIESIRRGRTLRYEQNHREDLMRLAGMLDVDNDEGTVFDAITGEGKNNFETQEPSAEALEAEEQLRLAGMIDQAAKGRKVTKTGLVAVSEGELIIPSELNPYYHKKTDKAQQIKNENNIVNKFWGMFAEGGTAEDTTVSDEEKKDIGRKLRELKAEVRNASIDGSAKAGELAKSAIGGLGKGAQFIVNTGSKIKAKAQKSKEEKGLVYQAYEIANEAIESGKNLQHKLFGTKEEQSKLTENVLKVKDSVFGDKNSVTDKLAGGAAGALIGGGAGLLLGGPIIGAVLGAGAGIVLKSKETQKVLFGDEESGKKGILPKKVSDFMQKNLPDMAKGAAVGTGAGLFLGSPVMGAVLGSAVGYVKSSDTAKKLIFGEMVDGKQKGGIIPKELQDKVKKAVPNMAVGAIGGALLGPLGLAGNLVLGSAVGYATSTDKFKKWLFGDKENGDETPAGGFVSLIKENVAEPLVGIFDSLAQSIRTTVRATFHNLGKSLRKIIVRQFRIALSPFARAGKNILGKGAKFLEGVIGNDKFSVGTILKGTQRRLQNKALRKGNMIYDRKLARFLNPNERNELAEERGIDRGAYGSIDKWVSDENRTTEDVRTLFKNLNTAIDPGKEFEKQETISKTDSVNILGQLKDQLRDRDLSNKDRKKAKGDMTDIEHDIRKNRFSEAFDKVTKLAKNNYISRDDENRLRKQIVKAQDAYDNKKRAIQDAKGTLYDLFEPIYGPEMAKQISELKDTELMKVLDNLKEDTKNMEFKTREGLSKEKQEEERKKLYDEVITRSIPNTLVDIKDILLGRLDRFKEADELDEKYQVDDPNKPKSEEQIAAEEKEKKDYRKQVLSDLRKYSVDKRVSPEMYEEDLKAAKGTVSASTITKYRKIKRENWAKDHQNESSGDEESGDDEEASPSGLIDRFKQKAKKLGNRLFGSDEPKAGDTKVNEDGEKMIFTNGEWKIDNTDSETRQKAGWKKQVFGYLAELPKISLGVTGLGTLFGSVKDLIFGDGKNKKGLMGSLKKLLFGDDDKDSNKRGLVGWVKKILFGDKDGDEGGGLFKSFKYYFGDPKLMTALSSAGSALAVGAAGAGILTFLGASLSGKFDNLFSKVDTLAMKDNENLRDENGNKAATDENGEPIVDENGNVQMEDGSTVPLSQLHTVGENTSWSKQLAKNAVRGVIIGNGSVLTSGVKVAGKLLKKSGKLFGEAGAKFGATNIANGLKNAGGIKGGVTKLVNAAKETNLGKGVTKISEKVGGLADDAINSSIGRTIMDFIPEALSKVASALKKIPFVGKFAGSIGNITGPLQELVGNALKNAGAKLKNLATKISDVMPFIAVGTIVLKGIENWGSAANVLGITDTPTFGQRCIATFIGCVNTALPIIGDLIPDKAFVNFFMKVAPMIGIDVSELQAQREKAQAEAAEAGMSVEELNEINGNVGVVTKVKHKVKDAVNYAKTRGIKGMINDAGNKIKKVAGNVGSKISGGIKNVASSVNEALGITEIFELAKKGDIKGVLTYNAKDEDDSGMMGIAKNGINMVTKQIALPVATFTAVGKGVKNTFDKVTSWGSNVGDFISRESKYGETIMNGESDGGFKDMFTSINPPEGPFQGILKGVGMGARLVQVPVVIVKRIGRGIGRTFDKIKTAVTNDITSYRSRMGDLTTIMKSGEVGTLWDSQSEYKGNSDSPLAWLFEHSSFAPKALLTIPTLFIGIGKKVGEFFGNVVDKVKNHYENCNKRNEQLAELAKTGNLTELMNYQYEDDGENPLGWVFKHTNTISKFMYIPSALLHKAGNAIGELFDNISNDVSTDWDTVKNSQDTMKGLAEKGEVMDIIKTKFEKSKYNPIGGIHNAIFTVSKIFYGIYGGFEKLFGSLGDLFNKIKNKATEKLQDWGIIDSEYVDEDGNTVTNKGAVTKVKEGVAKFGEGISNIKNSITNKVNNFGDNIIEWANNDKSATGTAAAGSGFVSQMDPRYADIKLGKSTVAEMGCGPAVATMALNMRAKGSNMKEAIDAARGYQTSQGTDMSYFGDYYRSKGVDAKYYNNPNDIYNSIAAGTPTVLMGRDGANNSKRKSPFGPNNHYVVANGFDRNGNIIVNDPEMNRPRSYSTEILNNVRMAVGMGSGINNRRRRFGFGAGGGPLRVDATTQAVWGFLINNGFSEAAAAGVMGNMDAESGINPAATQKGGPAIGICQWEGGRKEKLYQYAASRGVDWTDLATQLQYMYEEVTNPNLNTGGQYIGSKAEVYKSVSDFMKATDPIQATTDFFLAFERGKKSKAHMEDRHAAAKYYYEQFTGKTFNSPTASASSVPVGTTIETDPTAATPASTSTGSSFGSSVMKTVGTVATGAAVASAFAQGGSILDKIKNAFSTAFGMSSMFGGISAAVDSSSSTGSSDGTTGTGDVNYSGQTISDNPSTVNFTSGATPVDFMKSVAGKVNYDMSGPRDPEKGSADCSSTVQWAIRKATGIDIGGSTPAQYTDDDLNTVWYDGGKVAQSLPANIQPNDVLFFSRPNSGFTAGRTDRVGHVELYEGNGMMIGHGSGMGPKEKKVPIGEGKNGGLIKVMRLKSMEPTTDTTNVAEFAKTSGLNIRTARMEMEQSAAGSGLMNYIDNHRDKLEAYAMKNVTNYSNYASKTRIPTNRSIDKNAKAFIGKSAGASAISNDMLGTTVSSKPTATGNDQKGIALLVKSLIPLVEAIVKNTNSIDGIYNLVGQLVQKGGGTPEDTTKAMAMISESMKANKDIDSDLQGLKDTVERILAG